MFELDNGYGAAVCKAAAIGDPSTVVAMQACDLGHWLVSWYSSCETSGMADDAAP